MKNLLLVHGFNVTDSGKATIGNIPFNPEYYNIQKANYGYFNLLGVRFFNDNIAKVIAGMVNKKTTAIGHSNGCSILLEASKLTNNIENLIFINPALDCYADFPDSLNKITIIHNEYDHVVSLSRILLFHSWGDMGKVGYLGTDKRITNLNSHTLFRVKGHSTVLTQTPLKLLQLLQRRNLI